MVAASSPSSLGSSLCFLSRKLLSDKTTSPLPTPACVRFRSPLIAATYTSTERTTSPHLYSSNMASAASLYDVLGIPMGATGQEIKAAYRRLVRVCHPDAVAADRKDTSANEFKKIHAAYSTLSDPHKRADYNRTLISRQRLYRSPSSALSLASSMSGFSRNISRTWETDQCW